MATAGKDRKTALYEDLKQAILTLELRPGTDLDEASLCKEYNLSRTPLREVFRQLAGEGFVYLRQNRGARVSDMSHQTLRDFFLVAPMIYSAVLKLAAENATPAQIQRLKLAQQRFKSALRSGDVKDRTLANNDFHAITGEMSDNVFLLPSFHRLLIDHARIGMTFYRPHNAKMTENLGKASEQHDAIIESIEAGDAAAAGKLAGDHWNLSRGQIESFVMPSGLDLPLGKSISA
jgi:DNA-binding GntR family transcriptional regulator